MPKIITIIVTRNRPALLKKCVDAVISQTLKSNLIYVIDNASDVPATEVLKDFETNLIIKRNSKNVGCAGGFEYGIIQCVKENELNSEDFIWLMDDDSIPNTDALEKLIGEYSNVQKVIPISFGCSLVMHGDDIHKMNLPPIINFSNNIESITPLVKLSSKSLLVESCSFVSVIVKLKHIEKVGLPLSDLFIWGDDVEFTRRISKNCGPGIFVLDSIVQHETKNNANVSIKEDIPENAWKYYFNARNVVYNNSQNFYRKYKILMYSILKDLKGILGRKDNKVLFLKKIIPGYFAGIFFKPKIKFLQK